MNPKRKMIGPIIMVIMTILTSACSASKGISSPKGNGGWIDWDGEGGWEGSTADKMAAEHFAERSVAEAPASMGGMVLSEEAGTSPKSGSDEDAIPIDQSLGLRAGSVDDNAEWDDYLLYRIHFADCSIPVQEIDVTERHIIRVSTSQGLPVLGARISIFNDQGSMVADLMTTSNGQSLFFPLASPDPDSLTYVVKIEKDGQITELSMERDIREHEANLEVLSASEPVRLDVHFLIDATGSMSDEIAQLKENMIAISERIHDLPARPDVRFGMTIYRDRGDEFISRTLDFTPDIEAFTKELSQVVADGGDDYPESLNEGLHNAIHLPEWRIDESVSLIFLIADAPPHLDYANDYDYAEEVFEAATRGIKIFPLASSGLDDQGEYIFRQLAQITNGKFLFLTYGPQGEPGDETSHHVDDYSVLSLDQLIIRIVEEELANLNGEEWYGQ
jgi:hypothetical protein